MYPLTSMPEITLNGAALVVRCAGCDMTLYAARAFVLDTHDPYTPIFCGRCARKAVKERWLTPRLKVNRRVRAARRLIEIFMNLKHPPEDPISEYYGVTPPRNVRREQEIKREFVAHLRLLDLTPQELEARLLIAAAAEEPFSWNPMFNSKDDLMALDYLLDDGTEELIP